MKKFYYHPYVYFSKESGNSSTSNYHLFVVTPIEANSNVKVKDLPTINGIQSLDGKKIWKVEYDTINAGSVIGEHDFMYLKINFNGQTDIVSFHISIHHNHGTEKVVIDVEDVTDLYTPGGVNIAWERPHGHLRNDGTVSQTNYKPAIVVPFRHGDGIGDDGTSIQNKSCIGKLNIKTTSGNDLIHYPLFVNGDNLTYFDNDNAKQGYLEFTTYMVEDNEEIQVGKVKIKNKNNNGTPNLPPQ